MSADTSSRVHTTFAESSRDLRGRLGNPEGVPEQNTETWHDFLRQRAPAPEGPFGDRREWAPPIQGAGGRVTGGMSELDRRPSQGPVDGEIVLPKWQPDSDVSVCPICNTDFTFWYRKHHCRKCGRVICANCSPHRITIPRQYIVQPPGVENALDFENIDATFLNPNNESSSSAADRRRSLRSPQALAELSLGGGEEVRICNPCVPDPNTSPPPYVEQSSRPHRRAISYGGPSTDNRPVTPGGVNPGPDVASREYARPRRPMNRQRELEQFYALGQPMQDPMQAYEEMLRRHRNAENETSGTQRPRNPLVSGRGRRSTTIASPTNSTSSPYSMQPQFLPPQYHDPTRLFRPQPSRNRQPPSNLSSQGPQSFPYYPNWPDQAASLPRPPNMALPHPSWNMRLPQIPAPILPESEICPCCHKGYQSLGVSSDTSEREKHVQDCVQSLTSASTMTPDADTQSPRHGMAAQHTIYYTLDEREAKNMHDNGSSECVICMDEFLAGQEMGRLECFCRFHRRCIEDWFKAPAQQGTRCPVHLHW